MTWRAAVKNNFRRGAIACRFLFAFAKLTVSACRVGFSALCKEANMKFMLEYQVRQGGLTTEQSMENSKALLTAFGKWKPEEGLKVLAFVSTVSGLTGYILVEASDPKPVQSFVSKFNYWNETKVVPVMDIEESVPVFHASLAWAKAASKG
jgi:hypothetical protein